MLELVVLGLQRPFTFSIGSLKNAQKGSNVTKIKF